MDNKPFHVFVLLGDGELNEGIVWEAAETASKYELDNLTAIVDCNGYQSCGSCTSIMPARNLEAKWHSFGWMVEQIDGHDMEQIIRSLTRAKSQKSGKPKVLLARTVKGKGVSFMENDNSWHQRALTEKEWQTAAKELGGIP